MAPLDELIRYHGLMVATRPNLFWFAPSELSQDAVLCWCLAWADGQYASEPALHAMGRDLVSSLLRAAGSEVPTGSYTVTVLTQVDRADIVAEIGEDRLLVIEDKVHSAEHSDQLKTYASALAERYPTRKRTFVFLKTGDQSSYTGVKADGWTTFLRRDLLEVLRRHSACPDPILRDFLDVLEERESGVRRFETQPVATWEKGDPAYIGLYTELQRHFEDGRWNYVPNPSGGFIGFWWNFEGIEGGEVYLQLQEDELVAKVWAEHAENRRELRNLWFNRVTQAISGFERPQRFGHGEYMTVATRGDYRVRRPDGCIDLDATLRLLREVTDALSRLAAHPWDQPVTAP